MFDVHARPHLTLLLAASLATTARADVLVVDDDGGPGVDHITIASAVSASKSGDLILVRDGTYSSFSVDTRSLAIVADVGHDPVVLRAAFNTQDPLAGPCVLQGIDVDMNVPTPLAAMELRGPNPIWVESCEVSGMMFGPSSTLLTAHVIDGKHVFVDSVVSGSAPGVDAISVAADSTAYVYGGVVRGGDDNDATFPDGGVAVSITTFQGQSKLAAYGSEIRGGTGADGTAKDCVGKDGRSPLRSILSPWGGENFEVLLVDSTLSGGAGGTGFGACADGQAGASPGVGPEHLNEQPGTARHLAMNSPIRPFETLTATFTGDEGDIVFVLKSFSQGPAIPIPDVTGPYHLGLPELFTGIGTIPASGELEATHTFGDLAIVDGHLLTHYQALMIDTSGNVSLSNPVTVVLLGAGI